MKNQKAAYYFVFLLVLLLLCHPVFSLHQTPSVNTGWSNRVSYTGVELTTFGFSSSGSGLAFSYQTGSINRYNKTKKNILEFSPGINYIYYPDSYVNFRFRANFRVSIPITYGLQYNHILGRESFSRQSAELLFGFAEYSVYSFESLFWKFLIGYDFELKTTNPDIAISPFRVHFCLGYNFSL